MQFVGIIVPYTLEVRVIDTTTEAIHSYMHATLSEIYDVAGVDGTTTAFQQILQTVPNKLDALIIVSAAQSRIRLEKLYTMACGFASYVQIITAYHAKFLATTEACARLLTDVQSFGIVTNAIDYEIHMFRRVPDKENTYKCCSEEILQFDNTINLDLLKVDNRAVDSIIHVKFNKASIGSQVFTSTTSCKAHQFNDFVSALFMGAIVKAKILAKTWKGIIIKDFAETMLVRRADDRIGKVCITGEALPFKKVFKTYGPLTVLNNVQLHREKAKLKLKVNVLHESKKVDKLFLVTIMVDEYGRTKIRSHRIRSEGVKLPEPSSAASNGQLPTDAITTSDSADTSTKKTRSRKEKVGKPELPPEPEPAYRKVPFIFEPSMFHSPPSLVVHEPMSRSILFQHRDGRRHELLCPDLPTVDSDALLTPEFIAKYYATLLSIIPDYGNDRDEPDMILFVHDGAPRADVVSAVSRLFKIRYKRASKNTHVITATTAYLHGITRYLKINVQPSHQERIFCAFIHNKVSCRYFCLEHDGNDWNVFKTQLIDVNSPEDLVNSLSHVNEQFPQTTHRLVFTENLYISLQRAFGNSYFSLIRFDLARTFADGALDYAELLHLRDNEKLAWPCSRSFNHICPEVYLKQSGELTRLTDAEVLPVSPLIRKLTVKASFQILQNVSMFSSTKYVLHEREVPEDKEYEIHIVRNRDKLPRIEYTDDSVPTSTFLAGLEDVIGRDDILAKWMKQREERYAKAVKLIEFDIEKSMALVILEHSNGHEVVHDPNQLQRVPVFVSFAHAKPRIGVSAMHDYLSHPESVVFDIMKILGRNVSEVTIDPKWKFSIESKSDTDDTAMIVVERNGQEFMLAPEHLLAMFLKGVLRMIEEEKGCCPNQLTFPVLETTTPQTIAALSEACKLIGIEHNVIKYETLPTDRKYLNY
uniref:ATP-dependent DNA helicase n=1 Tax=Panagrellus redivivus TaxID=6233 RepID=A0A7E4VRB9_PANRE